MTALVFAPTDADIARDFRRIGLDVESLAVKFRRGNAGAVRTAAARAGLVDLTPPNVCPSCGDSAAMHAHHDDYNKPLATRWLCVGCHRRWHASNTATPHASWPKAWRLLSKAVAKRDGRKRAGPEDDDFDAINAKALRQRWGASDDCLRQAERCGLRCYRVRGKSARLFFLGDVRQYEDLTGIEPGEWYR